MPLRLCAWLVHVYTALGLLAAAGIAVLIVRGDGESFRWVFMAMLAATLIDATDGMLARWARVKEVLPGFDGRRLDDLIDFLNYASLPLLLIWRVNLLPGEQAWWLLLPLMSSAYGFCQAAAKTDDGYFLGFPSYWNIVAFYLYVLQPAVWASLGVLVLFSLLTFVPCRYLYPTQRGLLNQVTCLLGAVWGMLLVVIILYLPEHASDDPINRVTTNLPWLVLVSLFFPVYYLVVSWAISLRRWLAA